MRSSRNRFRRAPTVIALLALAGGSALQGCMVIGAAGKAGAAVGSAAGHVAGSTVRATAGAVIPDRDKKSDEKSSRTD